MAFFGHYRRGGAGGDGDRGLRHRPRCDRDDGSARDPGDGGSHERRLPARCGRGTDRRAGRARRWSAARGSTRSSPSARPPGRSKCAWPATRSSGSLLAGPAGAAFGAMARISTTYYVQDSVLPRTRLPEVLPPDRRAVRLEYGMQVANVFHAGDGNLHPLVCYDGVGPRRGGKGGGAGGTDRKGVRRRRRIHHRRARGWRGQEALHAVDVLRAGSRRLSAAPLLLRPGRPRQPGQGDADAEALRRGAGALPEHPLERDGVAERM